MAFEVQFPWLFDLYYQLAIIIGVGGLAWLLYRIIRHRYNIMQIIEERTKSIYIVLMSVYFLLGIYYVFFGVVNYDEGTEIYVSNLVYDGKIPYIDFMYTHSPLMPYIYGIPQLVFGSSLYVGRFTSLFFGVLMLPFITKIAERFGGKIAGVVTLSLVTFNPYSMYLLSYAKSYELTVFFMVLSLYFLFCKDSWGNRKYIFSVLFMCLAGGVRQIALVMPILLVSYIAYMERKNVKVILQSVGTGAATLGVLFVPFLILNQDVAMFNLYSYYVGANPYATEYNKVSNFYLMIEQYLVISVFFFVGAVTLLFDRKKHSNHIKFLYVTAILLYAVHLIPQENLPEHPIILVPTVAILAGYAFSVMYKNAKSDFTKYFLLLMVPIMILFVLVANGPQWIDVTGDKRPIQEIDEMAGYIRNNTAADGKLFALSTYAAVQADRELLPGLSQAYYSYRPDWSDETAKEFNGVNYNLLDQYIRYRNASAILLTNLERDAILGDQAVTLIEQYYDLLKTMEAWGQYSNTAYLYVPKKAILLVEKLRVNYTDTQTWSARLPPNAVYDLTLRSLTSPTVISLGSGNADANGNAGGSFVVGGNLPTGTIALHVELIVDPSTFDERIFMVGEAPITVSVQKSKISYGDYQFWSATGFVPYEAYFVAIRSATVAKAIVIGSGNADANGNVQGAFFIGGNVPSGDNVLRIEVASDPSLYAESTFRVG